MYAINDIIQVLNDTKLKLDLFNVRCSDENKKSLEVFEKLKIQHNQNIFTYNGILTDIDTLKQQKCLTAAASAYFNEVVKLSFKNVDLICGKLHELVEFNSEGLVTKPNDWLGDPGIKKLLEKYIEFENQYKQLVKT